MPRLNKKDPFALPKCSKISIIFRVSFEKNYFAGTPDFLEVFISA